LDVPERRRARWARGARPGNCPAVSLYDLSETALALVTGRVDIPAKKMWGPEQ
jgi:hypothetical protein